MQSVAWIWEPRSLIFGRRELDRACTIGEIAIGHICVTLEMCSMSAENVTRSLHGNDDARHSVHGNDDAKLSGCCVFQHCNEHEYAITKLRLLQLAAILVGQRIAWRLDRRTTCELLVDVAKVELGRNRGFEGHIYLPGGEPKHRHGDTSSFEPQHEPKHLG